MKTSLSGLFPGVVLLFVLAHFAHHIPGFVTSPLLPSIRDDLGLSYYQASWLVSAYSLAYGASNLPAGWLAGRIAPRILIILGVAGVALAGLLVGISPVYGLMITALLVMGVLGGGYHPVASPLVSDGTPIEKRGRALGIHQIGGTAANIVTPPLAAAIATAFVATIGWRGSYIVLTIPIIIFGVFLGYYMQRHHIGDTLRQTVITNSGSTTMPKGFIRRMFAFVVLGTAVQVFVFSSLSFVTLLVVDQYKGSEQLGAALFALSQFSGLFAGPIGGHLSDRFGKTPMMLIAGLASGPLIYLLGLSLNWWLLAVVLLALGCCMYIAMPVSEAYVISHASPRNRSTVLGIYYFASRGGPGILSPVIGKLLDASGFGRAFSYTGGAMFAIAAVCSLLLWGSKE